MCSPFGTDMQVLYCIGFGRCFGTVDQVWGFGALARTGERVSNNMIFADG